MGNTRGSTVVLGLSCDYHDAAAAIVVDGDVVAAAEEERFSRTKHDNALPRRAIAACLRAADVDAGAIDAVVFHEKPLNVASRVLAVHQRRGPAALAKFAQEFPVLVRRNLMIADRVEAELRRQGATRPPRLQYCEHHLSHAAAAFYPSPFEASAILTIDGIGEWSTATIGHGSHHRIDLLREQRFPHSLGLLYSLATAWCGFEPNDGEYKLMGLAPYGVDRYRSQLAEIVQLADDGALRISEKAVRWWAARPDRMRDLTRLFDGPPRAAGDEISERDLDLACSVQRFTEDAVLAMANAAQRLTGETNLCLAGGVALNCVANGRLAADGPFEGLWVQPAAGDAGSAIGAALWWWHGEHGAPRQLKHDQCSPLDGMSAAALGPAFGADEIDAALVARDLASERHEPGELERTVARELAEGAVIGWFEGRMEFGPRALGHRSILADPRSETAQRDLNVRVKGRESFRPFAPSVLWEHSHDWFDISEPSPYMLRTAQVASHRLVDVVDEPTGLSQRAQVVRSQIPACTHVDGSSRVQTVHPELHPRFHRLISEFYALTGCPVLLNTSFNRAGEPIVCSPDDAIETAIAAGLDLLVIEDRVVRIGQ